MLLIDASRAAESGSELPGLLRSWGAPAIIVTIVVLLPLILFLKDWLRWLGRSLGDVLRWASPEIFTVKGRRRAQRRRAAAEYLIDALNLLESDLEWSRETFTEIRANIRALDSPRHSRLPIIGLRRVTAIYQTRSLSKALARERERIVLVQGPPGSGKSVAMRHFARTKLERARRRRHVGEPLPVWVNLRDFDVAPDDVTADRLKDYIVQHVNPLGSPVMSEYFSRQFDRDLEAGRVVLLLDSFDEIPAILGTTNVDRAVRPYIDAIVALVGGTDSVCIVASREYKGPRVPGWTRLEIVGLSYPEQVAVLQRYCLSSAQLKEVEPLLFDPRVGFATDLRNPMHLSLLARYVRDHDSLPSRPSELFEAHVQSRLRAVVDEDEDEILLEDAMRAFAFQLTSGADHGLAAEEELLTRQFAVRGPEAAEHRARLSRQARESKLLVRVGARDMRPRIAFAHRRVQEYMATRYVIEHPDTVPPAELASNGRWRETAVALLQVSCDDDRAPLLAELERVLRETNLVASEEAFDWPEGSLHALELLVAAYGSDPRSLPADLRGLVGDILEHAWREGSISDRKFALDAVPVATAGVQASMVEAAFGGSSEWLRLTALRDCGMLHPMPQTIEDSIRRLLITLISGGRLSREAPMLDSDLDRLYRGAALVRTRRLLAATPFVVLALCCTVIAYDFLTGQARLNIYSIRSEALFGLILPLGIFWLVQSSLPLSFGGKTRIRVFFERALATGLGWNVADNETQAFLYGVGAAVVIQTLALWVLGVLDLIHSRIWIGLGLLLLLPVLHAYALAWGPTTLVAVRERWFSDRVRMPEVALSIWKAARPMWRTVRRDGWGMVGFIGFVLLLQAALGGIVAGVLFLLERIGSVGHTVARVIVILLLSFFPIVVLSVAYREIRSRRRVSRVVKSTEEVSGAAFVDALSRFGTPNEALDYIRMIRVRRSEDARKLTRSLVRELERLIEAAPQEDEQLRAGTTSIPILRAIDEGRLTTALLVTWKEAVLDELGRLEEDLRER